MTPGVPMLSRPLSRITSRLPHLPRPSTRKSLKNDAMSITPFESQPLGASVHL